MLLLLVYAVWVTGIIFSCSLLEMRLIRYMARIILSVDNKLICLEYSAGPLGFPVGCPSLISLWYSPVSTISLSSTTISSLIYLGAYFKCSARNLSHPLLLLFLMTWLRFQFHLLWTDCLIFVVLFPETVLHYLCRIFF